MSYLISLSARKEMSDEMHTKTKYCRMCGTEIPRARLEAISDTLLCVACSEEVGEEFELEVTISGTGKAGSLKKTGQQLQVKRKRKAWAVAGQSLEMPPIDWRCYLA